MNRAFFCLCALLLAACGDEDPDKTPHTGLVDSGEADADADGDADGDTDSDSDSDSDADVFVPTSSFAAASAQWNMPTAGDYDWKIDDSYSRHAVMDMNGDGQPDFVDSENQTTTSSSDVWKSGSQQYWKVYLNNGAGFSASSTQWNIPTAGEYDWKVVESYSRHAIFDMDGDGLPDFVDTENENTTSSSDVWKSGSQQYWKVYLNTGSGFSATATQWNIPVAGEYDWKVYESYSRHAVLDMDGDGRPDFVDTENQNTTSTSDVWVSGSQQYWKVYLNTGSGFSATATQWNIPVAGEYDWKVYESYGRHAVLDMDGDGLPDFIDSENQTTSSSSDVWKSGSQQYWKVYLNTGSGFSATATQWNIPVAGEYDWKVYESYSRHTVQDMDGDDMPDFVDTENQTTTSSSDVWKSGSQQYWKVYLNTGAGFAASAEQWNIPVAGEYDWKSYDSYSRHAVFDLDGDGHVDFVDSENQNTGDTSDVWKTGSQQYWKLYAGE